MLVVVQRLISEAEEKASDIAIECVSASRVDLVRTGDQALVR
jgi:hypothetical protein